MEILAIHPGALGDVVLLGQFLATLKAGGEGPVRLVAGGEKARLLAGLGAVDEALDFDGLPMEEVFSAKPLEECALPRRLGRCDLLVSCFAAGKPEAQARLKALCGAARALFLPIRPPGEYPGHLVEFWRDLAGLAAVPVPAWTVPPGWRREAGQVLEAVGLSPKAAYLLLHPGAGAPDKCWPLALFMELARAIASAGPATGETAPRSVPSGMPRGKALFVIGPAEVERWKEEALVELRMQFPLLMNPPLPVLAALAAGARAFVGNDSGPTHLAAAVGTPTLALVRPPQDVQFAPRGQRVKVLSAGDLLDISVEAVLSALKNT